MTQQDDITQRVLTDDELQALWDEACKDSPQAPGWNRHLRYGRAIESALLSKLRAPVADERAAFEHHARACELTRDEDEPDEYRNSHVQEYWNGWKARAALASAPVAGAAQEYGSPADVAQRIEQYLAQDGRMNSGTQLLYEAMKALRASQGDRNDG